MAFENTLNNLTWPKSDLLLINERSSHRERSFALAEDRGFIQPPGIPNSGLCRPEETTCLRGAAPAMDVTRPVTEHEPHSINHSERQLLNNQSSPLEPAPELPPETYSISFPITPLASVCTQSRPNKSRCRFLQNKSFWPSITERQKISCYEFLCSAFESAIYEQNLTRSLEIPTCRVIPYFKHYLDKLKIALSSSTNFSFTTGTIEEICAKVSSNAAGAAFNGINK